MAIKSLSAMEKRCSDCKLVKLLDEFVPRTDPDTDEIIGYQRRCKKCDEIDWKARRDGLALVKTQYDDFGNEMQTGDLPVRINLFTEAVREESIAQIRRDRSIQNCADHLGIAIKTLSNWLENPKEPYASWARRFRLARSEAHKKPIVAAMEQEAVAGNVRAMEFLLKTGWKDEFSDTKELEMTVRRGTDEIDPSKYSVEELQQLRHLLTKGQE